jgi:hypothetical protein
MVSEVPGTGQRHRTGASSGADFGFWRLSAREKSRRLGRFRDRRRFIGANITQRTILVVCIHPRASPAIGQNLPFLCMQVDEQGEQETQVNAIGLLNPTNACSRVLAQRATLAVRPHTNTRPRVACPFAQHAHTLTCAPTQAQTRACACAPPCSCEHASLE